MKQYILKKNESPSNTSIQLEKSLNASQLEVVQNADGPCLVLAGAGSGKTRTLIYRVLYLLDKGVPPDNILLVTFTNKAASEMKSRVERYLGSNLKGLWCGTFHHVGLRILRRYSRQIGIEENFGVLDQDDSKELIRNCYNILPFKPSEMRFPQAGLLQKIFSLASNLRVSVQSIIESEYIYFDHWSDLILKIHEEYQKKKIATHNLDFDDLLLKWIQLMKENPDIHESLATRFKYCLVDEYQDINSLQNEAIEMTASKHKNLLVVGDDAQSIYSFRGAQIDNILNFPKRHSNVRIFKLELNYRSCPEILNLANASISQNQHQFPKELSSVRESGITPQLIRVRDQKNQSEFVAQQILQLVDEGMPMHEIAVLFRARYHAADLELELAKRKIGYVLRGGVKFFEQAHIKDSLAYLKIILNPHDELSWNRVLQLYPGIGLKTAKKLHEHYLEHVNNDGPNTFFSESILLRNAPKRSKTALTGFNHLMIRLMGVYEESTPDVLIQEVVGAGYDKIIQSKFENAQDRLDDLKELMHFAHTYKSLEVFLNELALRENFRGESFSNEVGSDMESPLILSTIHQAKGLEWSAVFVLSLAEGQFPHYQSSESERALEEERRLFYVATTRAKNDLYLMHPMTRWDREMGSVLSRLSPFVEELPDGSYEVAEVVEEFRDDFEGSESIISLDES